MFRKFPLIALLLSLLMGMGATSCLGDDSDDGGDYRKANDKWWSEQASLIADDGTSYYTLVSAEWDPTAQVLVHWFNDRNATSGNLQPLYNSTVDVKYYGQLYDGTAFDSSYTNTSPADSIFRTQLGTNVISGWTIALTHMHVGDSCRIVVPYTQGYNSYKYGSIPAYSMLQFDIKLVDIPYYEAKP